MPIKCGEKEFTGAQAAIYRYAGQEDSEGNPDSGLVLETNEELLVKVMVSNNCPEGSVAAQLVEPDLRLSPGALKVVHKTALSATEFSHPNIIPYLLVEMNEEETMLKIVMPRKGGSLNDWLRERRGFIPENVLLSIAKQLVDALSSAMHSRGILHLDMALGNVLVNGIKETHPICFICDLESAALSGEKPVTEGTYEFSAPERSTDPSEESDVFSLGVMLLSMGARAEFPGIFQSDLGNVTMNMEQLTPTRIAAVVRHELKNYSEALISLVTMMLNHDRATRPRMTFLLENIEAIQRSSGGGYGSGPDSPTVLQFPFVCGPFDLHSLRPDITKRVVLYPKSSMYDAHVQCAECGMHRSFDRHQRTDCNVTGQMHLPAHMAPLKTEYCIPSCEAALIQSLSSPEMAAVTAVNQQAASPNRPFSAVGMYFLYPFVSAATSPPASAVPDAAAARGTTGGGTSTTSAGGTQLLVEGHLQRQGGFAWVPINSEGKATADNAIVIRALTPKGAQPPAAEGNYSVMVPPVPLFFTAPQPWISQCTAALYQAGRIHREVPPLFGRAKSFCWILPGEKFTLPNAEDWIPAEDGGFVFFFGDDPLRNPNQKDRFFAIAPSVESLEARRPAAGEALWLAQVFSGDGAVGRFATAGTTVLGGVGNAIRRCFQPRQWHNPHQMQQLPAATPPTTGTLGGSTPTVSSPNASGSPSSPHAESLVVLYRFIPTGRNLHVRLSPPFRPTEFRIPLTGEYGTVGDCLYLTPAKIAALGVPGEAKYIAFCRVDEGTVMSQVRRRNDPTAPSSTRLLPQHGFVLFNIRYEAVGLLSLRVTTASSPDCANLQHFAKRIDLQSLPPTHSYGGQLPPGELVEVDATVIGAGGLPLTVPGLPAVGGRTTSTDENNFGSNTPPTASTTAANPSTAGPGNTSSVSLGYVGWNNGNASFYFSDESQSQWLVRQWHTIS